MPADPTPRPLPPLKRFARLEMDGDPPPEPRPAKKAAPAVHARPTPAPQPPIVPREREDVASARRLAADLTDNARVSRDAATPQARRAERATMLRERVTLPPPSAPMPQRDTLDDLEDRTPGVVVMEVDLRGPRVEVRERRTQPTASAPLRRDFDMAPPGIRFDATPRARAEPAPGPIELTPMAARQVMLMAWQAGMPGSGLRILTSWTPGLGGPELDFAFDDDVTDDDHVFLSHGVRVIVDRQSLGHVRGRRITWHDVPGSEGFALR